MAKAPIDIRSLARQHTSLAINTLAEVAGDIDYEPAPRVSAAVALLDRGWGKPTTTFSDEIAGDIRIVVRHIVTGERPIKTVEQIDGSSLVTDKSE